MASKSATDPKSPGNAEGQVISIDTLQGGMVAGRDIIFGDSTEFFEPQLDDVKPPDYLTPPFAFELIDRLARHRLLILGGHQLLDRETFARHLAWLFATQLETSAAGRGVEIRQWSRDVDRGRLLASFQSHETSTVFLLRDARPTHFGFDALRLRDDLTRTGHFAILSSVSDHGQWGLEHGAESWLDAPCSEIFPAEELSEFLGRLLAAAEPESGDSSGASLLCGLEPRDVVAKLETPNRIKRFVDSLEAVSEELDVERVTRELEQLADGEVALQRWYRRLSRRHQLLAMGLVLFGDLYDDQIFAALEEVMNAVWKTWDPRLSQFDFRDLEELRTYFPNAGTERLISSRSVAVRQGIFEIAWALHRRHLMAALPVSIKLLKGAVQVARAEPTAKKTNEELRQQNVPDRRKAGPATPGDRSLTGGPTVERLAWDLKGRSLELWGSAVRSAMLRDSTGDALSRVSKLSADGLDSHLRALASDRVPAVRLVAAKALAGWRRSDGPENAERVLFDKLREWNERALESVTSGWRGRSSALEQRRNRACIRATVAMAVGYSALYDPPDQMSSELVRLVEKFLDETDSIVQNTFSEVTLPMVMGAHLVQLEPTLRESAHRRTWLRRGLALGFVLALELRPDDTLAVMDSWHAQSQSLALQAQPGSHEQIRENVLAALIEAYSLFSSFSQFELFGIEVVFSKFQRIMAEEKGRYLRRLTLWGALVQFQRQPSQAEPWLQDLVAEATLEERADLIEGFGFIFWQQRQVLEGGDVSVVYDFSSISRWTSREKKPLAWDQIAVRGSCEFSVWLRSEHPLTPIEQMLRCWLQDEGFPVAQQLAFETLVDFYAKERWLIDLAESQKQEQLSWQERPPQIRSLERSYRLTFLGRLFTYLSVSETSGLRNKVLALLPQLLRQYRTISRLTTAALLASWKHDADQGLARLATRLKLTASFYRRRYLILGLLAAAAGYYLLQTI